MKEHSDQPNSFSFYGRVLREDKTRTQTLRSHLLNVANRALESARDALPIRENDNQNVRQWKENLHNTAHIAGLLHDLEKYRKEFQEYLLGNRGRSAETNHAVYGSAAAVHHFGDDASAFAIAGHHAGLHDIAALDELVNGEKYSAYKKYVQLMTTTQNEKELGTLPEPTHIDIDDSNNREKHSYEFMTRILFSILVDSDRLDAEQWEMEQKIGKPWQRQVTKLEPEVCLKQNKPPRSKLRGI